MGLLDGFLGGSFSQDPSRDEAMRMAVLAASLGLLGGQGRNFGQIAANAGLQGLGMFGGMMNAAEQGKDRQQQRQLREMQMQQTRRGLERQQQVEALAPKFYQPAQPGFQSEDREGGTVQWPQTPGQMDYRGYANALGQIDPQAGLDMLQKLAKETKLHYQDTGRSIDVFDQNGQLIRSIPKGISPDAEYRHGTLSADTAVREYGDTQRAAAAQAAADARAQATREQNERHFKGVPGSTAASIAAANQRWSQTPVETAGGFVPRSEAIGKTPWRTQEGTTSPNMFVTQMRQLYETEYPQVMGMRTPKVRGTPVPTFEQFSAPGGEGERLLGPLGMQRPGAQAPAGARAQLTAEQVAAEARAALEAKPTPAPRDKVLERVRRLGFDPKALGL